MLILGIFALLFAFYALCYGFVTWCDRVATKRKEMEGRQ